MNARLLLWVVVLGSVSLSGEPRPCHSEQASLVWKIDGTSPVTITRIRKTPLVMRYDQLDPLLLEVTITGGPSAVIFKPVSGPHEPMYDDGTHGDVAAGDGVYSMTFAPARVLANLRDSAVFRPRLGSFSVYQGSDEVTGGLVRAQVWTLAMPAVPIRQLSATVQYSPHLVNIVGDVGDATTRFAAQKALARQFYGFFGDDYDFIHFVYTEAVYAPIGNANRSHTTVSNRIDGVGLTKFDISSEYGSRGKLLGISTFPVPEIFDGADNGYVHEIGHQWINYLSLTLMAGGIAHWPYSDMFNTVMGANAKGSPGAARPWKLEPTANGYKLVYDRTMPGLDLRYTFSDLDLYLMGLVSAEEVAPHIVFKNTTTLPTLNAEYPISDFNTVTIQDIRAAQGPRRPDVTMSQKSFRIATIIVSPKLLSAEAMQFYDFFSARAELREAVRITESIWEGPSNPFFAATGGRATLSTEIDTHPRRRSVRSH